ncbi:two component transcriptional regulator, winged helix family protein [Plesiocystis pacifica SIR-1]|uniref:Two component transcriptional regulator, winged helix family protein n=1 Tax=Plesiocystis pacifica SIR-1 TaxID=391625 RepID=A6GE03_9BACT|nr:response regulator transcription factor [Plesiocystis pacifica]EDM75869.1 two component transcriptional regulator, winged helix family protein [Plesiocystis pacifica SIR-1]
MPTTILIVEDEQDLLDTLEFNLQREGYATRRAASGRAGLEAAALEPAPDLVLLDLMLPDISGTEVCRQLRAAERTRSVPVVMLTARGEEVDRVVGFEVGADDYVTKPFSVRELMLRVRAILRRAGTKAEAPSRLQHGDLEVDVAGHRVWVGGNEIRLTALEFRLLATLLSRAGRVQTRDTLLSDVWGMHAGLTTRTVDTHVTRLRKKLGDAGSYIETLRGVGYRFRDSQDGGAALPPGAGAPSPSASPGAKAVEAR